MQQAWRLPRVALLSLSAIVASAVVAATVMLHGATTTGWDGDVVGAVLATIVFVWVPFTLPRSSGGVGVSFEPCVLVYLLMTHPSEVAVGAWLLGFVIGHVTYRSRVVLRHRIFNVASGTLAGAAAVTVVGSMQQAATVGPNPLNLLVILVALAAYLVVDVALTAVQLTREISTPVLPEIRQAFLALSALLVGTSGAMAFLAVVVHRDLPSWTLLLVLVPLLTLMVVGRALVVRDRAQWTHARLYEAATAFAALTDAEGIKPTLLSWSAAVLDHGAPELRHREPDSEELGVQVLAEDEPLWLVHRADHRPSARDQDLTALRSLADLGEQARVRLSLQAGLNHSARHDPLTGLANRSVLVGALRSAMDNHPSGGQRGLLMIDLDDFKAVNDRFGHLVGDEYLQAVAGRIRTAVDPGDVVARLGGDEFAVLVLGDEPGGLSRTAAAVLTSLGRDLTSGRQVLTIGASIGATGWSTNDDVTSVLSHADLALYAAKQSGKNAIREFHYGLLQESVQRNRMIDDLRLAIPNLQVHYQPVVDLERGCVDGSEALVRWCNGGVDVPPALFVPLAEDCGLIRELGRHVLRRVTADLPAMHAAAGRPVSLAVNLSAHQLGDPELPTLVRDAVRAAAPAALLLEMTERVLVDDDDATLAAVQELTSTGAKLVLDDFGAGYSAIGYLRRLPVDVVKLDRSLIAGLDELSRSRDLVDGLLRLCRAMRITTLAEGVETDGEWATVVALGCTLAQGYIFGRAQPLEGFLTLLRTHGSTLGRRPAPVPAMAVPEPR
ncbi:MAG: EAL domain-containing protein [Mycobacteriaceae bacterium]